MPPNTSGEEDRFERLKSRAEVLRYSDSYAVVLLDVKPNYIGRRVVRFEVLCCNARYTYDAQVDSKRWIKIIEYKRVRLNSVLAMPALRVPLSMAVSINDVFTYLRRSKQHVTVELVVAPP